MNPDLQEDRYIVKKMEIRGELKQAIVDLHTHPELIISTHNLDEDLSEHVSNLNREYHEHVRKVLGTKK